jgi:hypothetical protein
VVALLQTDRSASSQVTVLLKNLDIQHGLNSDYRIAMSPAHGAALFQRGEVHWFDWDRRERRLLGSGGILAAAAGDGGPGGRRFADVGLLSAVSTCFALGAATIEQFKHLAAEAAGPLAGRTSLPGLRTLRPRLAEIADAADSLELQAMFAQATLGADPVTSGVYYVDDHFVPYAGARPVAKGWNNKRGKAEKGRADTHVTACDGRAVCFTSGEPSGLTVTLPLALAELKRPPRPARGSCSGSTGAAPTRRYSGTAASGTCTG